MAKEFDKLPNPTSVGQIVRLHRVFSHFYKNTLTVKNHAGFDFLLVRHVDDDNDNDDNDEQQQQKLPSYMPQGDEIAGKTFTDSDRQKIKELHKWSRSIMQTAGVSLIGATNNNNNYHKYFETLQRGKYCDMICKIVSKVAIEQQVIAQIWDGTPCTMYVLLFLLFDFFLFEFFYCLNFFID